jgi:predicted alpha/beta-hydrolase family hydrolase
VTATLYAASANDRRRVAVMLAHGAGANQTSAFMVEFAQALAARGFDTITFNFLYSEAGKGPPDRNDRLEACYRAMIAAFHAGTITEDAKRSALVIGGKSMGGRIASQVVAATPEGVAGLVLLGYPLHPPGRPDKLRSKHLPEITVPMLVVQGSRDSFGTPEELRPILKSLKASAELYVVEGGDHSFKVPKRGAPPQAQVHAAVLDEIQGWLERL